MREIQLFSILILGVLAVLCDLYDGKIPNQLLITGLVLGCVYQWFTNGLTGIVIGLGGCLLPFGLFWLFFYFRMLGAGDIKLMCVIGMYLGPANCFKFLIISILFGGVISLVIMFRYHNLYQRLICFSDYFNQYSKDKKWKSYVNQVPEEARFRFSVPILCGIIFITGGLI